AITDWVDADDNPAGLSGAESQFYADAEPARLPANASLASPSELMWVKGMTPEIYRALKPLVTIWPREGGQLNLNTAPPALIASVNDNKTLTPLPAADLERLLEERKAKHVLPPAAVSALLNRQIDSGAY